MGAFNGNVIFITGEIPAAGTADISVIPVTADMDGEVISVQTCLAVLISGADEVVTISKNALSMGTITIANSSSAIGDIDELIPTSANRHLVEGDYIKITNSGASTGAGAIGYTIAIKR